MLLGTLFTGEIAKSALVAYIHYLGIILCFGSLFERLTLKVNLNRNETISMIIADVVYGLQESQYWLLVFYVLNILAKGEIFILLILFFGLRCLFTS